MVFNTHTMILNYNKYYNNTINIIINASFATKILINFYFLRVLRELEVIRQESTLLKEQMGLVKDDIKAVYMKLDLFLQLQYNLY